MDIALVFLLLLTALVLFATEWLRMDLVSLLLLLSLAVTGLVSIDEAFSGFSNPAVITVAAMFIISAGLTRTGALTPLGNGLMRLAGGSEMRMVLVIMLCSAGFSAFINNIGATAMLLPLTVGMARNARISPSKLLIPLAFGSLLGGVCTLIGTPPNILMNNLLEQYTGERFGMFDFTPVGLAILATGTLYMALIGRHLLPVRKSGTLTEAYQVKEYITEAQILDGSPLHGQRIGQCDLQARYGLKIRAFLRSGRKYPAPHRNRKLYTGDTLLLEGSPEAILALRDIKGLTIVPERDNPPTVNQSADEMIVIEAALSPNSGLVGKTLRDVHFIATYGLTPLALWRAGAPVVRKVDRVVLRFGDVLLLQGPQENVMHLGADHGFLLLGDIAAGSEQPQKAPLALAILVGTILLASADLLPIMLAASLGALAMVLSRCLNIRDLYTTIDWSIIVLIAGTLPLGLALEKTGAARLIADQLVGTIGPYGPLAVLCALFLLTSLLTEIMSHAAAAVLIAPIAYNSALDLAVSPQPFFMVVAVAASSCFMTPISHQSNALVMGPGGYRFSDYLKVGAPMNLLIWLVATVLIPFAFPF
jgi:di/tricarboxylate transporter